MNLEILDLFTDQTFQSVSDPIVQAINQDSLDEAESQIKQNQANLQDFIQRQLQSKSQKFLYTFKKYLKQEQELNKFEEKLQSLSQNIDTQKALYYLDKAALDQKKQNFKQKKKQIKKMQKDNKTHNQLILIQDLLENQNYLPIIRIIKKLEEPIRIQIEQHLELPRSNLLEQLYEEPSSYLLTYIQALYINKKDLVDHIMKTRTIKQDNNIQNLLKNIKKFWEQGIWLQQELDETNINLFWNQDLQRLIENALLKYEKWEKLDLQNQPQEIREQIQQYLDQGWKSKIDNEIDLIVHRFHQQVEQEQYQRALIKKGEEKKWEKIMNAQIGSIQVSIKNQEWIELKFTSTILDVILEIQKFVKNIQQVLNFDPDLVHLKLDQLYLKLISIYQNQLEDLSPIQLAWADTNINHLRLSISYFLSNIESEYKIIAFKDYISLQRLKVLQNIIEDTLSSCIRKKIDMFLDNYKNLTLKPKVKNEEPEVFIQDLIDYLISIYNALEDIDIKYSSRIVQEVFQLINLRLIDLFFSKKYNIVGLANIQQDISHICKKTTKSIYNGYIYIENIKEFMQFMDIFFGNSIFDCLKKQFKQIRDTYEGYFDQIKKKTMIKLLKNYEKVIVKNLPTIKNRDIKMIIDNLSQENTKH